MSLPSLGDSVNEFRKRSSACLMKRDDGIQDMFRRFMSMQGDTPISSVVHQLATIQPSTSEDTAGLLYCLETVTISELCQQPPNMPFTLNRWTVWYKPPMSWSRGWSFKDGVTVLVDINANAVRVIVSKHYGTLHPFQNVTTAVPWGSEWLWRSRWLRCTVMKSVQCDWSILHR